MQSTVAFTNFFWYMTSQGFALSDLVFAWDWGSDGYGGFSTEDQLRILAIGQSVYFVTLVIVQMGNLMATRKRSLPYGYTPTRTRIQSAAMRPTMTTTQHPNSADSDVPATYNTSRGHGSGDQRVRGCH